jgi:hypothetical protein
MRAMEECVAFARGARYRTLPLWTNDIPALPGAST